MSMFYDLDRWVDQPAEDTIRAKTVITRQCIYDAACSVLDALVDNVSRLKMTDHNIVDANASTKDASNNPITTISPSQKKEWTPNDRYYSNLTPSIVWDTTDISGLITTIKNELSANLLNLSIIEQETQSVHDNITVRYYDTNDSSGVTTTNANGLYQALTMAFWKAAKIGVCYYAFGNSTSATAANQYRFYWGLMRNPTMSLGQFRAMNTIQSLYDGQIPNGPNKKMIIPGNIIEFIRNMTQSMVKFYYSTRLLSESIAASITGTVSIVSAGELFQSVKKLEKRFYNTYGIWPTTTSDVWGWPPKVTVSGNVYKLKTDASIQSGIYTPAQMSSNGFELNLTT